MGVDQDPAFTVVAAEGESSEEEEEDENEDEDMEGTNNEGGAGGE